MTDRASATVEPTVNQGDLVKPAVFDHLKRLTPPCRHGDLPARHVERHKAAVCFGGEYRARACLAPTSSWSEPGVAANTIGVTAGVVKGNS